MLTDEAQRNFGMSLEAYAIAPCIDAQIALVRRHLLSPDASGPPLPLYSDATERFIIRTANRAVYTSTWQSQIADGTLNHMNVGRVGLWGAYYQTVEKQNLVDLSLLDQANSLVRLATPLALSPEARERYLDRLEGLAVIAKRSRSVAIRVAEWHRKLGLSTPASRVDAFLAHSIAVNFCREHGFPMADWRKVLDERLPPMAM